MVPAAGKQLFVSALRHQYIQYCLQEQIDLPAAKNKMGQAIAKIHNKPEIRQQTHGRITKYFYHNYEVLDDVMRQGSDSDIRLPNYFTMSVSQPYLIFNVPTGLLFDNHPVNFNVIIDVNTYKLGISVHSIELDVDKLGIAPYVKYVDQAFVDGLELILRALVLCSGKTANLAVDMPTRIISRHAIGSMAGAGQGLQTQIKWFSKNCKGVLPLTCELQNRTCRMCVHDVNARIDKDTEDTTQKRNIKSEMPDDDDDDDENDDGSDDDADGNGVLMGSNDLSHGADSRYFDKSDTEASNASSHRDITEISDESLISTNNSVSIILYF